jgi:hypothetical protein
MTTPSRIENLFARTYQESFLTVKENLLARPENPAVMPNCRGRDRHRAIENCAPFAFARAQ